MYQKTGPAFPHRDIAVPTLGSARDPGGGGLELREDSLVD